MNEGDKSGEDLVPCSVCKKLCPADELHELTFEDTQGYGDEGKLLCPSCLEEVRYHAFTLEDEDVYDIEDN